MAKTVYKKFCWKYSTTWVIPVLKCMFGTLFLSLKRNYGMYKLKTQLMPEQFPDDYNVIH